MPISGTALKQKIENKIFKTGSPPASTITITSQSVGSTSFSGYGGYSETTTSSTTTVAVPYGNIRGTREYYRFGTDEDGETRMALKASESININDLVYLNATSKTYQVTAIDDYPYDDVNVAIIVTAKELLR